MILTRGACNDASSSRFSAARRLRLQALGRAPHSRSSHRRRSFGSGIWVCSLRESAQTHGVLSRQPCDLGYQEGRDFVIEYRWADGKYDQLPALLADLIRLKVDVIVTHGTPGVLAAKQATTTTPIVMAVVGDALGSGIVSSLARPGGT